MIPKLHKNGKSFKGAAAYLLHDKGRAESAERVSWTETRNIATDDPHVAWRVMAATAMNQGRLKEEAGIKNTGRKSAAHVLHFTLSWHPEEGESLSREEMIQAATASLKVLGRDDSDKGGRRQFADEHQSMFIIHDDEPQPHMHILLNRVHPEHGVMLPSSNEKLSLSKWAEAYEKERGHIYCEDRVLNNAARDRGEYVRGEKDKPRHIFELEAVNGNQPNAEQIREAQRKKDAALALRRRELKARHDREWLDLLDRHQERKEGIRKKTIEASHQAKKEVRDLYKKDWRMLYHEHQASLSQFGQREERFLGRIQNAMKSIDYGAILRGDKPGSAIREGFQALSSQGIRLEAFKRNQLAQNRDLERRQKTAEKEAAERVEKLEEQALDGTGQRLAGERAQIILAQQMDQAALRAEWRERSEKRRAAWKQKRLTSYFQEKDLIHEAQQKLASEKTAEQPSAYEMAMKKVKNIEDFRARQGKRRAGKNHNHDDRER